MLHFQSQDSLSLLLLRKGICTALLVALATQVRALDLTEKRNFDIASQALSRALLEFSHQAGIQVIVGPEVTNQQAPAITGKRSIGDALDTLLKGAELAYTVVGDLSIAVGNPRITAAPSLPGGETGTGADGGGKLRLAQAGSQNASNETPSSPESSGPRDGDVDRSQDEVVVTAANYVVTGGRTANKADIPLIETPQSITVVSRDMIDLLNLNSLNEAMRYVAGGQGEAFGPDERYDWLTVRGFAPVQFVDGVQAPIASTNNTGTDLYGFESVEILKGPASALYGQSPPGGIVNMASRRPRNEFGGEFELQRGEYDYWQLNGDVTGPLSERVSARLTALYRNRDTQVDFLNSERTFVAPAVTFDIGPQTTLTLLAKYQKDDVQNHSTGYLPAYGTFFPNPLGKVPVGRNMGEPGVNFFHRTQYSVGYSFEHRFNDFVSLEQNATHFNVDSKSRGIFGLGLLDANFDGVPDDYRTVLRGDFPFNEDIKSTTVDTRVALDFSTGELRHAMLAGLDYRHYVGYSEFAISLAPPIDLFDPVYGAPVAENPAVTPFVDATANQTGVYVQDQIKAGRLILTLSGRQDFLSTDPAGGARTDEHKFSYRAGVNYLLDSGFAPYLQTGRSFQPVTGADFGGNRFVPTTGTQIEGGLKWDGRNLPGGVKLFASAAVYRIVQQNLTTPDPAHPGFSVQTGEVEVKGAELEASARIRERLSFNFAFTRLKSEVTETNVPGVLGKDMVAVPKTAASALVDYTFQTGSVAGLGAGFGVRYRGTQYGDDLNAFRSDSLTLFDLIVHYDTADWRVALNASNLADKIFVDRCFGVTNCFYGTRRQVTASLTRKF